MTAVLNPPSPGDTRSVLADWMELQVLGNRRGIATHATLSNVFDIAEDGAATRLRVEEETGEVLDEAILEEVWSAEVGATFEELEYRQRLLGVAYPFLVDSRHVVIRRAADNPIVQPGHVVYLFCLLASAIREGRLHPETEVEAARQGIADTFQICACIAAGGYINGPVAWFGFPRPTGNAFLPALKAAYDRFGIGHVRDAIPEGLPLSLKDGGIDVIAWRDFSDRMPGKTYLLGQCASGTHWKNKSVVEYIETLHGSWFTTRPATVAMPAMFIPFPLHHDIEESRALPFLDVVRNSTWHNEMRFGIIFDRLRIAQYAHHCLTCGEVSRVNVDGVNHFDRVRSWVRDAAVAGGMDLAA